VLKKTITFKDLEEKDVTEDFYFSISKAELSKLALGRGDDFSDYLNGLIKAQNGEEIMSLFDKIIAMSVGVRHEDGRRFIKTDDIRDSFMQSDAYSVMFMELIQDTARLTEFIRGTLPSDLAAEIDAKELSTELSLPKEEEVPAWIREDRDPTKAELMNMSQAQLTEAFLNKTNKQAT